MSCLWSSVGFKIDAVTLFFKFFFFVKFIFGQDGNTCIHWEQISHNIQRMVAKRGLTNRANVHTLCEKKSFKTQHGSIPIDPASLAAIGHRFIAKQI